MVTFNIVLQIFPIGIHADWNSVWGQKIFPLRFRNRSRGFSVFNCSVWTWQWTFAAIDWYCDNTCRLNYYRLRSRVMQVWEKCEMQCGWRVQKLSSSHYISHQTRSTVVPLSVPHLANINFVRSGHLYHNDLQTSKSQWGGLWEMKIFCFTVFWWSRTCSIVDHKICDCKHHAEAPDDTSWKSRCKAGLLLLGRHIMTIIHFKP